MLSSPFARPSTAAPAPVSRRAVEQRDLPFLRALFAESRHELALLTADVRDLIIDMQFRARRGAQEQTYPAARHEIVCADGTDVGLLVVDDSGTDIRVLDLVVTRPHTRRGVGSAVLTEVVAGADASGRAVVLTVWPDNEVTRLLHERFDFGYCDASSGELQMRREPATSADPAPVAMPGAMPMSGVWTMGRTSWSDQLPRGIARHRVPTVRG